MKTLRYIGMAFVAIFMCVNFTACSDDDDNETSSNSNDLVGVWQCVSVTGDGDDKFEVGDQITFSNKEYIDEEDGGILGKSCQVKLGDYVDEYAWNIKNNTLTIMECDLNRWTGSYTIKDDTMVFSYTYQDWNWDSQTMTEEFGPFTATFKKK